MKYLWCFFLFDFTHKCLRNLQLVQNSASHRPGSPAAPLAPSSVWCFLFTFKAIYNLTSYLSDLLHISTRSSSSILLFIPHIHFSTTGSRAFSCSGSHFHHFIFMFNPVFNPQTHKHCLILASVEVFEWFCLIYWCFCLVFKCCLRPERHPEKKCFISWPNTINYLYFIMIYYNHNESIFFSLWRKTGILVENIHMLREKKSKKKK